MALPLYRIILTCMRAVPKPLFEMSTNLWRLRDRLLRLGRLRLRQAKRALAKRSYGNMPFRQRYCIERRNKLGVIHTLSCFTIVTLVLLFVMRVFLLFSLNGLGTLFGCCDAVHLIYKDKNFAFVAPGIAEDWTKLVFKYDRVCAQDTGLKPCFRAEQSHNYTYLHSTPEGTTWFLTSNIAKNDSFIAHANCELPHEEFCVWHVRRPLEQDSSKHRWTVNYKMYFDELRPKNWSFVCISGKLSHLGLNSKVRKIIRPLTYNHDGVDVGLALDLKVYTDFAGGDDSCNDGFTPPPLYTLDSARVSLI